MSSDAANRMPASPSPEAMKREVFYHLVDHLKDVGLAITSVLGKWCEVVIHDVTDLEHSIIWIEGDVTHRRSGGIMTDLGLEKLRTGDTHPLFNYTSYTENGRMLKSCTIWLRDLDGQIRGAFCINADVTVFAELADTLGQLASETSRPQVAEDFGQDLRTMLETMIAEWEYRTHTAAGDANKEQRVDLVHFLDARGAFLVRNAVPIVAGRLGVSRKTIYNYLNEPAAADEAVPATDR